MVRLYWYLGFSLFCLQVNAVVVVRAQRIPPHRLGPLLKTLSEFVEVILLPSRKNCNGKGGLFLQEQSSLAHKVKWSENPWHKPT